MTQKIENIRLLWMSRHLPTPRQRIELGRLFPDASLRIDPKPFADAADVMRRIRESRADELICVAPLSVLQKLSGYGICPIVADMELCSPDDTEAEVTSEGSGYHNGRPSRTYKFVRFRRLMGIEITYEEIKPCATTTHPAA